MTNVFVLSPFNNPNTSMGLRACSVWVEHNRPMQTCAWDDYFATGLVQGSSRPPKPFFHHQHAGSRISRRMASIAARVSGVRVVPNAAMSSSSCATLVTPMMVLATCHLV